MSNARQENSHTNTISDIIGKRRHLYVHSYMYIHKYIYVQMYIAVRRLEVCHSVDNRRSRSCCLLLTRKTSAERRTFCSNKCQIANVCLTDVAYRSLSCSLLLSAAERSISAWLSSSRSVFVYFLLLTQFQQMCSMQPAGVKFELWIIFRCAKIHIVMVSPAKITSNNDEQ